MAGYPWSAGDQLNAADLDVIALSNVASLPVAEAVLDRAPLALGFFQSDGGVKFDAAATQDQNAGLSGTSITQAITVGVHSNRILIAAIGVSSGGNLPSGVTANGVSMTQVDTVSPSNKAATLILVAPATGSINVVFGGLTNGASYEVFVYSYYNAAQSAQPNAHNITNGTTLTLTTSVDGCLIWGIGGGASSQLETGLANNLNSITHATNAGSYTAGDMGVAIIAGTTPAIGSSGGSIILALIAIAPFTAVSYGYVANARSSAASSYTQPTTTIYKSTGFCGFAIGAQPTPGSNVLLATSGLLGGFTGLTPLAKYYLNDSNGTIGTSPGTNTREVGIAMDSTHLLITNVW
jgi:hypothetical protein